MSSSAPRRSFPKAWAPKWQRFFVAVFVSSFIMNLGHSILDVHIELYRGLEQYNFSFVVSMFLLPVFSGVLVGLIYGWGGKWVAHFPPLFVFGLDYYLTAQTGVPTGAHLIPLMWWGFFVILNMEFCALGGVIGELLLKYKYGSLDMPGTTDYAPADAETLPRNESE